MPRVVPSDVVAIIDQLFPDLVRLSVLTRGTADRLRAVLDMVDAIPPELIAPLDRTNYAGLVANLAAIREALENWRSRGEDRTLPTMTGFSDIPLTVVRDALQKCPDDIVAPGTAELAFLSDEPELREDLRLDLSHAERAMVGDEWKAATVLAGSVLEALLLWALDQPRYAAEAKAAPGVPMK